jgi:hypothetical protein
MKKFLSLLILSALTTEAYSDESLEIKDFKISASVGNLNDSKTIAIQLGLAKALEEVMMRLKTDNDKKRIDIINCLNQIDDKRNLVENLKIKSERMTSKAYSALLNVTFKKDVTSLLNKCGISYGSFWGGKIVLVPIVIDESDDLNLVDEKNHYFLYKALSRINNNVGTLEVIKILDKNTIENYAIELEDLVTGDYNNTMELIHQLKGETLLVIIFKNLKSNNPNILVKISTENKFYNNSIEKVSLKNQEDYQILIKNILTESDLLLKKGLNTDKTAFYNSLVIFELVKPDDWQKLRLILNKIPEIKEYRFKTIGNDKIELELRYSINPNDLSNNLLKDGVSLFKRNNQTIMKLQ